MCKTLGDMLIDVMSKHKDNKLTVISGFVKTNTTYSPSDNIVSITGLNHDVLDKVQIFKICISFKAKKTNYTCCN